MIRSGKDWAGGSTCGGRGEAWDVVRRLRRGEGCAVGSERERTQRAVWDSYKFHGLEVAFNDDVPHVRNDCCCTSCISDGR